VFFSLHFSSWKKPSLLCQKPRDFLILTPLPCS
jgi:hypothetical protein